jgi:hypothetical protein
VTRIARPEARGESRPDTVEAKCREIFVVNLHDLESEFREDVQKTIRASHTNR